MAETIQVNQVESVHGGKRIGAGRPKRDIDLWMRARGATPLTAAMVMASHGEARAWKRLLTTEDDAIFAKVWLTLMMQRDGKPAQQINVSSVNVNISADEAAKARAIIRELMSDTRQPLQEPSTQKPVLEG